ncbi:MAG: hypothetical protein M0P39_16660 [Rhodocyclaceae bacterium]|nr:hypothetical protein [Rhodocyclaceae bacterium]
MKIKLAVAACALLSIGSVMAAEPADHPPANTAGKRAAPNPVVGFGSGTGMGPGGSAGSASSVAGGFGSQLGNSGAGGQTFGGGFDQQQVTGSGPLSTHPAAGAGGPLGP